MLAPLTFCEQSRPSAAIGSGVLDVADAVDAAACISRRIEMLRPKVSDFKLSRTAISFEPAGKVRISRRRGRAHTYNHSYI